MQSLGRAPQRHSTLRRDPSPSRWAYRMQRLWLTPVFRVLVRFGLPVLVISAISGLVCYDDARRAALLQSVADLRAQFESRPEFRVSYVSIDGASPDLADAVRAKLGLKLPQSSFDLDLDLLQQKAEELDAVAEAQLRLRSGGVLQVVLTEREPAMVWRLDGRLVLLDATGQRVAGLAERGDRADLPLVAGEGADAAAVEALAILDAAGPIAIRLRGLVRMGERRWDLVLDRNQRIQLPAQNPVPALERLLALDQAEKLLDRDILTIDLRHEQRPVLRLAPFALSEVRRAQGLTTPTGDAL